MSQSSKPAGNEWFDQFARTSLIYRIMEKARAGELPEDRTRAILSLGERGDPRAVVTLMECCSDTDPVIRMNAIDALTRLKSGRAVPTLIGRLEDPGESLENRCRAAKALAEINTHTSAEGLMTLVNDEEEEPALREYIAVLMEKQGLG
jgi:HEAT repeat protein